MVNALSVAGLQASQQLPCKVPGDLLVEGPHLPHVVHEVSTRHLRNARPRRLKQGQAMERGRAAERTSEAMRDTGIRPEAFCWLARQCTYLILMMLGTDLSWKGEQGRGT